MSSLWSSRIWRARWTECKLCVCLSKSNSPNSVRSPPLPGIDARQLTVARAVSGITSCEFSPGAARDLVGRMQLRESCHHRLSEWQQGLPPELVYQSNSKNLWAMCLQITFLSQLLLLNRPVIYTDITLPDKIRKPSETIAGNAADAITKISDDLVKMWGARYMSQHR